MIIGTTRMALKPTPGQIDLNTPTQLAGAAINGPGVRSLAGRMCRQSKTSRHIHRSFHSMFGQSATRKERAAPPKQLRRATVAVQLKGCRAKRLPLSACHAKGGNVGTGLLLYRPSILVLGLSAIWLGGCTSLSPLRPNTAANPNNSVVAKNGYKIAFIEFGEQGS